MPAAPIPTNETERLKALHDLGVLDTLPEEEFDALVQAASLICDVPISLISLIDTDRQWFKANIGLPGAVQTPRSQAFCAHAILGDDVFEVDDALNHPTFCDNQLVLENPKIRFYAGAPISVSDGIRIGTLCVIDTEPKQLSDTQRKILAQLAIVAGKTLKGRRALITENSLLKQVALTSGKLIEAEHRYRALADYSPIGVYLTDSQGACIYTNNKWQALFGLSLAESLGQGWIKAIHPDDLEIVFALWELNAKSGEEFDLEFRTISPTGHIRYVHSRAKPITNSHGDVEFLGTVQDITLAKMLAQENAALLSTIRSQFLMSITDLNGRILEANDSFCALSEYSREQLIGADHRIINSRVHPSTFFGDMWATVLGGKPWRGEICNKSASGQLYWVDSVISPLYNYEGQIDRIISIRIDISERKRQEEVLRKNRELLARTGEIAGIGGWEVDLISGTISWSDKTCQIHGVEVGYIPSMEEAVSFYTPEGRDIIQSAIRHCIDSGEGWDLELPFIQKNGNNIWVRAAGSIEYDNGVPARLTGVFQDITQRMQQTLALSAAHERLALATESGRIGVWEYDLEQNSLAWDARMYELYGLNPKETTISFESWRNSLHPEDRDVLKFAAHQLIQDEVRSEVEFRIRTTDGVERFLRGTALKHKNNLNETSKLIGINWDVTDLRTLANELEEQHELLRVTLQSIGDAVITTDAAGNTVWLNPVAERMTGWTCDEAKGRPLGQIFHIVNEETRLKTENPVATCLEQGKVVGLANHTILISRSGDEFGIEDSAAPIISTNGDLLGVVLVFHDVTEQRRLSGEVNYRATHDALTGLVNRAEFENRLRRLLHSVHEDRSQHALMYIDLDQFKIVNDTCGHSVGDELLQQISKLFQLAVRTRDTLARLGGDEFAIILEHCTTEQAQRVAQQICDKMENYRFIHEMQRFRIGTSIGLVPIDNRWNTISMLMQAADTSCYAAKEAGRNRVHVWFDTDKAMRARHSETQWANRIELALDENRFELYAQHIISLADNEKGLHAELLLRMVERDGTIVTPDIFITAAERFHMASRIDRWVVRNAIMWLQNRPIGAPHIHTLAINLSGQSVGDRSFLRQLVEILTAAGSEICSKLCIEITETAAVTNMADAEFFIEEIHKLGLRISLDDFGAGSSSFGYLKNLSVDVLKIDGQFIRGILDDPLDDATVRCFVDVAKVVGLKTVAEFVNSPEILSRVKQLGVDYAQGYLIHKPEYIDQAFPLDIHFLNKSAI